MMNVIFMQCVYISDHLQICSSKKTTARGSEAESFIHKKVPNVSKTFASRSISRPWV